MYLLYLDEFGHAGAYDRTHPRHRQHPLLGFAGIAVEGRYWRDRDRAFLRLEGKLGGALDALTPRFGEWTSVFVKRGLRAPDAPADAAHP